MIRFGEHAVDLDLFELRRGGQVVPMQPKVFDVLVYLLKHRERVVGKTELLDALWPEEHVNESAIAWSISHARRAIGQQRGDKGPIETVHGRGYRFVGEVQHDPEPSSVPPPATAADSEALAQPLPNPGVGSQPPREPLVGREELMQRLGNRLDEARAGSGRLLLLTGEAGIGKTRCAEELAQVAAEHGMCVATGRCVEASGAPVFWPFVQALRAIGQQQARLAERCRELLTSLQAVAPLDSDAEQEQQSARRFWLLEGISRLIRDAASERPLLLLLEDLHWADEASLELLAFLAPDIATAPLLLLGTLREELDERADQGLRRVARHAERVPLSRLGVDEVARYIADLTGQSPSRELALSVHRATAGTPLFVQETLRGLIAAHGRDAVCELQPDDIQPPQVARDVLRTRLQALPAEERRLLSAASVLGERFELSLLQALADAEPHQLLEWLEGPSRADLVIAEAPHSYRFAHELLRSLLYADLPTARAVALHRKAANALLAISAGEPRHGEIALHFHRSLAAGEHARVVEHARQAAAAASAAYAYADAVRYYEWALEAQALDSGATARERVELLLTTGETQRRAGRTRDARITLSRMIEVARQHGHADLLLRAARVLRPTQAMSGVPDPLVRDAMEEVLRLVPDNANPERIGALSLLSCLPPYAYDMKRAKELSGRALQLARELGQRSSLLEAMRARLYSLSGVDDIDALLSLCDEMLEAETSDSSWGRGEALAARYGALLLRGRVEEADAALADLERVTRALRWPEVVWYHDRLAAQRVAMDGDFARAERLYLELIERSKRMRLSYGERFMQLALGQLELERQGTRAMARFANADVVMPGRSNVIWGGYRAQLARMLAELGNREQVERALEDLAARDFQEVPRDLSYLNTMVNLAAAAAQIGDRDYSQRLYDLLLPYAGFNTPSGMLLCVGSVDHYLALLAACLQRDTDAERHFEAALAFETAMGSKPRVARTRWAHAQWLCESDDPTRRARGHEQAVVAAAEADALGMKWLAEAASTLLA
ncbi:MAG: AAA family ATPase [Myxococcales bacterium]|nr:AAA family ATPase [Myxococcales bacterium]